MRYRLILAALMLMAISIPGCTRDTSREPAADDPTPAEVPQTTSAPIASASAVVEDLRAHGFEVTQVKENTDAALLVREALDTRIDGVEAGVLTFGSVDAAQSWAETSAGLGGIAVVGDTWAISLDSDGSGGTPKSRSLALAEQIEQAVGGTVR